MPACGALRGVRELLSICYVLKSLATIIVTLILVALGTISYFLAIIGLFLDLLVIIILIISQWTLMLKFFISGFFWKCGCFFFISIPPAVKFIWEQLFG